MQNRWSEENVISFNVKYITAFWVRSSPRPHFWKKTIKRKTKKQPHLWFNGQFLTDRWAGKQKAIRKRQESCQQHCIVCILRHISPWVIWYVSLCWTVERIPAVQRRPFLYYLWGVWCKLFPTSPQLPQDRFNLTGKRQDGSVQLCVN